MGFQAIKAQARRQLHRSLSEPCNYYAPNGSGGFLPPVLVTARLHYEIAPNFMSYRFRDSQFGERYELDPQVIVLQDELPSPKRGGAFVFAGLKAFSIEATEPPDGVTIKLVVSKMDESDTGSFVSP